MKIDEKSIEIGFDDRILVSSEGESVHPMKTIPKNEFKVREFCREHGIVSYVPVKKEWRVVDYVKKGKQYRYQKLVFVPMFTSYIFVKVNPSQRAMLWASKKIVQILTPSSEEHFLMEVRAVRAFELTGLEQTVEFNAEITENSPFVIESGIWAGVTGWLEKKKKHFEWTVRLDFVNQYVRTIIDPSTLKMRPLEQ